TLISDVTAAPPSGTPVAVNLSRRGQNGRYTISGSAGQVVNVDVGQLATVPATQILYVSILKPDGTTLATGNSGSGDSVVLNATLPTAGTYAVFLDPNYGATATLTL